MKKLLTILMLMVAILVGGMTIDAKTTKKKKKARTTQTSSRALWNGDMPTGKNILTTWGLSAEFAKKGYRFVVDEGPTYYIITKDGVCSIEHLGGMGGEDWIITVFDTSKLNWLYEDLKKAIPKNEGYSVRKDGNVIDVSHFYYYKGRP